VTGKTRISKAFRLLASLGVLLTLSSAPSLAHGHRPIVVGSKADTEGTLLGSMIALVLER
jgi:osmoprotectant transport system substrate-binding protein